MWLKVVPHMVTLVLDLLSNDFEQCCANNRQQRITLLNIGIFAFDAYI